MQLQPGQVLDGTYEIVAAIGSGGMGTVWRARHRRLPKEVAVKVLKGAADLDPEVYARFRREAEIASRLGHPHIVEALDFNTLADGTPYLVLELLQGCSLRDELRRRGRLGLEQAVLVTRQVASALLAAASQGVVHRDLKPENVFLCQHRGAAAEEELHAKILDFGISKIYSADTALTQQGTIFGTPLYMSPEQAQGQGADARSDQYALGVMVYEMLGGQLPFGGDKPMEVLYQVVNEPPPPLSRLAPQLPAAVTQAVHRALGKRPQERFDDVGQFAAAVATAAGFQVTPTPRGLEAAVFAPTVATPRGVGEQLPATDPPPGQASVTARDSGRSVGAGSSAGSAPLATPVVVEPRRGRWALAVLLGVSVLVLLGVVSAWVWRAAPKASPGQAMPAAPPTVDVDVRRQEIRRVVRIARDADHQRQDAAVATEPTPALPVAPARPVRPRRPTPARGDPPERMSLAQQGLLDEAYLLLRRGQLVDARSMGERLLRELPVAQRWQAHALMARVACSNQDLGLARAHLRNVERPLARRTVIAYCRRHLPGIR